MLGRSPLEASSSSRRSSSWDGLFSSDGGLVFPFLLFPADDLDFSPFCGGGWGRGSSTSILSHDGVMSWAEPSVAWFGFVRGSDGSEEAEEADDGGGGGGGCATGGSGGGRGGGELTGGGGRDFLAKILFPPVSIIKIAEDSDRSTRRKLNKITKTELK